MIRRALLLVLTSLLFSLSANASISFVNTTHGEHGSGTVTTLASTTTINVTAGNLLVLAETWGGSTDVSTAPTDGGDTFVEGTSCYAQNGGISNTIWYAKNVAANATATVTANWSSGVAFIGFVVLQYSGADKSNPFEVCATGSCATCTSVTSASFSPANSGNVDVAGFGGSVLSASSAGTNYTSRVTSTSAPIETGEDRLNAPSGSQTASGNETSGGSGILVISVASFKPQAVSTQVGGFIPGP